jgi:hypothetical protein
MLHNSKTTNRFEKLCEMFTSHFLFRKKYSYLTLWIIYKEVKNKNFKSVCKVANVTVCISMSVYPSAFLTILPSISPMHGTRNCWTYLRDILYWGGFVVKYVQKIHTWLKSDKNNKQFMWRTTYIQDYKVASFIDL